MLVIEASRRVSRAAVSRIRDAFVELDHVAYKNVEVFPSAEDAFQVIRQGRTYVLAVFDPTLNPAEEENLYDCGD